MRARHFFLDINTKVSKSGVSANFNHLQIRIDFFCFHLRLMSNLLERCAALGQIYKLYAPGQETCYDDINIWQELV